MADNRRRYEATFPWSEQMSATNNFVAELVRAANEVDRISRFEKMRLLDRAVITILDMRESVGIPPGRASADAAVELQTVAALIDAGEASDASIRTAMLDAAGMIRDLYIVLDTKTEIQFGDGVREPGARPTDA